MGVEANPGQTHRESYLMAGNLESVSTETDSQPLGEALQSVVEALNKLRFGAIQLTVHEGKLVQVDVTERRRFTN